jgi:hypothetical protein
MKKISEDLQTISKFKNELLVYKVMGNIPFIDKIFKFDKKEFNKNLKDSELMLNNMINTIDKFNPYFVDYGFINYEALNQPMAQKAVEIKENDGIEEAIEYIANWYCEYDNWHHSTYALGGREFFRDRIDLFNKAIEDHKSGRHYSTVLILLSLADGIADSIYLKETNTNKGFFSSDIDLTAWNSMAGHPQGLPRLKEVLSKSFTKVILDEVKIPYRHGILHGKVISYDNKYCAAICWNLIFALVDWSDKLSKGERQKPETKPNKPILESIVEFAESSKNHETNIKSMKEFKPSKKLFEPNQQPDSNGIEPENIVSLFFENILKLKPNYKIASDLVENYEKKRDSEKILILKNQFTNSGLKKIEILSSNIKNMDSCEVKIILSFENEILKPITIHLQYFDTVYKPSTLSHNSGLGKWYISYWQDIINNY